MESVPPKRRKMSLRRIAFIGLLTGIICLVGGHYLWGVLANYSLNRAVARLHDSGEPTTPGDLHLDDVPDAENASLDYKAAGVLINSANPVWKKFSESTADEYVFPLTDLETATARVLVSDNQPPLDRVMQARGKRAGGWHDDMDHPGVLPNFDFKSSRYLARLLKLAALDDHARRDDARTVKRLCDQLLLANAAERRPTLIGHLVAMGEEELATENIAALAPDLKIGMNQLNRGELKQLQQMLQDQSPINEGSRFSHRSERIWTVSVMREMADGRLNLDSFGTQGGGGDPFMAYLLRPTIRDDARVSLKFYQDVMTADAAPDWQTAKKMYPDWYMQKMNNLVLHLAGRMVVPSLNYDMRTTFGARTARRLAVVALAARFYAADHNDQLPISFDQLVPDYLPAIPIDPMSGNPLLFKADPPRFYSVGEDGIDNGGVPMDPTIPMYKNPRGDLVVYLRSQPRKPATH